MPRLAPYRTALAACLLGSWAAPAPAAVLTFDDLVGGAGVTSYEEQRFQLSTDAAIFSSSIPSEPDPPAFFNSQGGGVFTLARPPLTTGRFDLLSIAVREINETFGPVTVQLTGTLESGDTVEATFVSDGACCAAGGGYETFPLPDTFRDLRWVTFSGAAAVYDDVVVDFPAMRFDDLVGGSTSYTEAGMTLSSSHAIFRSDTAPEPPAIFGSQGVQDFTLRAADGGVFTLRGFELRELNDSVGAGPAGTLEAFSLDGTVQPGTIVVDGICCEAPDFGFQRIHSDDDWYFSVEWSQGPLVWDTIEAVPVAPYNDVADAAMQLPTNEPYRGLRRLATLVRASNDAAVTLGGSQANPDVWFKLVNNAPLELVVDTCGSHDLGGVDAGVDTVLSVHDALPASDANQIAGNDDGSAGAQACDGRDLGARKDAVVRVSLPSGPNEVWVRVSRSGASLADGDFVIRVPEPAGGAALAAAAALAALRRAHTIPRRR